MAFMRSFRVPSVLDWLMAMKKPVGESAQNEGEDSFMPDPDEMSCCEDEDYLVIPTKAPMTVTVAATKESQSESPNRAQSECNSFSTPLSAQASVEDLLGIIKSCKKCKKQLEIQSPSFISSISEVSVESGSIIQMPPAPIVSSTPSKKSQPQVTARRPTPVSLFSATELSTVGKENARPSEQPMTSRRSLEQFILAATLSPDSMQTFEGVSRNETSLNTPEPDRHENEELPSNSNDRADHGKTKRRRTTRPLTTPVRRSQRLKHKN